MWKINMTWDRVNVVSSWLYWSSMLHSDIVHLLLQFDYSWGQVVWVSVIKVKGEYDIRWNECYFGLTLFISNASLRHCAPASPIWFL